MDIEARLACRNDVEQGTVVHGKNGDVFGLKALTDVGVECCGDNACGNVYSENRLSVVLNIAGEIESALVELCTLDSVDGSGQLDGLYILKTVNGINVELSGVRPIGGVDESVLGVDSAPCHVGLVADLKELAGVLKSLRIINCDKRMLIELVVFKRGIDLAVVVGETAEMVAVVFGGELDGDSGYLLNYGCLAVESHFCQGRFAAEIKILSVVCQALSLCNCIGEHDILVADQRSTLGGSGRLVKFTGQCADKRRKMVQAAITILIKFFLSNMFFPSIFFIFICTFPTVVRTNGSDDNGAYKYGQIKYR